MARANVLEVRARDDYVVIVRFSDGVSRDFDMKPFLNLPIFQPLNDLEFFKKVEIEEGGATICWPNGADIAPETLRGEEQPVGIPQDTAN